MPRLVEKIIGPLTGLASEAVAHQRAKSRTPSPNPQTLAQAQAQAYDSGLHEPAGSDHESDEEQWRLDSAAEEAHASTSEVPQGNWASPASIETIVSHFVQRHPPGDVSSGSHLALPVMIPQKRPHQKARGFVRAYSPVLEDCGIDQQTWMEFLDSFHESIKVSPAFDVVNVTVNVMAMITNFVPSVAIQATSTVITVADVIAKETYTRSRTNNFIVEMNEKYFKPQGLYCIIITHKPGSDSAVETMDITTTVSRSIMTSQSGGSGANPSKSAPTSGPADNAALNERIKRSVKMWTGRSSAVTKGESEMPLVAPLIFPDLDQASDSQKQNWFKRGMAFTTDYFDKRASAQWRADHPDATLANLAPPPEFLSSRGDPTTIQRNATPMTAITGHESRLGARFRMRGDARQDRKAAQWEAKADNGHGIRGLAAKATKGRPPLVAVKRMMKIDVIYMLLVKLPTPEELEAVKMGKA